MRILCISDKVEVALSENADLSHLGSLDAVISCGDLPPEYLTILRGKLNVPLYYVKGNHDIRYQDTPPIGCTNIHGQIITVGKNRVLGLEGSRWYNGGPNQHTENQMRWLTWRLYPQIWAKRGLDMVVAHAPPRFIHDKEDLCHRGFKSYRHIIKRFKPAYFLHGHIHRPFKNDRERITRWRQTAIINCYGHHFLEC